MADLAPIAFFAFKRPFTTLQSLYSLSRCPEAANSKLYVFCDGPRAPADTAGVRATREVVRLRPWCGEVEIVESERNKGLAKSIVEGVSSVCASHGRVIVVEDDLLLASGFLAYMNAGLTRYLDEPKVMTIVAHNYDLRGADNRAVFLPVPDSWGWATWDRAWRLFDAHPRDLGLLADPAVRRAFDADGTYPFAAHLPGVLNGTNDAWAILWHWAVFRHKGLNLYPMRSLVKNVGMGPGATHETAAAELENRTWGLDNAVDSFPETLRVDEAAWKAWKDAARTFYPSRAVRILHASIGLLSPFTSRDERGPTARRLLRLLRSG